MINESAFGLKGCENPNVNALGKTWKISMCPFFEVSDFSGILFFCSPVLEMTMQARAIRRACGKSAALLRDLCFGAVEVETLHATSLPGIVEKAPSKE